jgi:SAM-dependent methyltransferase
MTAPDPTPDLAAEYRRRFGAHADYRRQVWRILIADYFGRFVRPTDAVLDLGSGWGEFINQVTARERYAVDLNPDAPAHLEHDVKLLAIDAASRWPLADGALDCVFTSNFLEHLPEKSALARAIAEAHRCLKPGGRLVCLGPNIRAVNGRYWDFFDHHVALSDRSLCELLELRGFEVDLCVPRFLPYTMSKTRETPLWTLRLYLRLPFLWRIFGEQFVVAARRAGG